MDGWMNLFFGDTMLTLLVLSCSRGSREGNNNSSSQLELDDLRLRQAVMAHHQRQQQQQAMNPAATARKKEWIEGFLCVETFTPDFLHQQSTAKYDDLVLPHGNGDGEEELTDRNDNDDMDTKEQQHRPTCAVCLEKFAWGDQVGRAQNDACSHYYHKDCIAEWLLHNMQCPLCKRNFLSLNGSSDEEDLSDCLLYTSPSPRDRTRSRMPSSA